MKETAKRLTVLMGMLALMLATAVPALGESQPRLTGVIEKPEVTSYMYGTHAITDELGNSYALESGVVDLDVYIGQRVSVSGAFVAGYEDGQVEGGPPLFEVSSVESAPPVVEPVPCPEGQYDQGYQYGPGIPICPPGEGGEIEVSFELVVEGDPPAGTTFYGSVGQMPDQLTDPDGDGVYEGVLPLPESFGTFPIPVAIIAGDPANPEVIKDFGEVVVEDGDVFSAGVSFGGEPVDPRNPAPIVDVEGNGSVNASDGEKAAEVSNSARTIGSARVLPNTGGVTLMLVGIGALLLTAAGLVVRRTIR